MAFGAMRQLFIQIICSTLRTYSWSFDLTSKCRTTLEVELTGYPVVYVEMTDEILCYIFMGKKMLCYD